MGKTQIAIEYVYRYEEEYNRIFWISGSDQGALLSGFQVIGAKMGCVAEGLEPMEIAMAVLGWLRLQENWLLVIDNLDDASVADGFLPATDTRGHTLITTRNTDLKSIPAEGLNIPMLSENDAIELLRIRSEISEVDFSSHKSDAIEIVKELGYLALAIDQAAAFIRSLPNIAKFLPIYRKSRKRLLRQHSRSKHTYPNSVAATFLLSFDKVKETEYGSHAAKLLHLLVFLNPDNILIDFLRAGSHGMSGELREIIDDELVFYEALSLLQRFSLVGKSQSKDSVFIHRIVQAIMRDELSDSKVRLYLTEVIGICNAAFPETWVTKETRELCRVFQSQVVEPAFEAAEIPSRSAAITLLRISTFLLNDGKLKDAERLNMRSWDIVAELFGTEHPDTLTAMGSLASTYQAQGKLQEAADLDERVLEATRRTLGEEHLDTLSTMSSLASTYRGQGKLQEAMYLDEKVLEAARRLLGEDHPDTLTSLNNLASTYREQGKLQEAADLEESVLEATRRVLGEEDPDTLTSMMNLAVTYGNQGKLQEAAGLLESALEAKMRMLGEENPATLTAMSNLASVYWEQGKLQETAGLLQRALEARRRMLGEEHPHTLVSKSNLALTYWKQGRRREATDLEESVLKARRTTLGEEHPNTLLSKANLKVMHENQGKVHDVPHVKERMLKLTISTQPNRMSSRDHSESPSLSKPPRNPPRIGAKRKKRAVSPSPKATSQLEHIPKSAAHPPTRPSHQKRRKPRSR